MSKMKYSGVKWIGEFPYNWSTNKIRYIYSIKGGNGFSDEYQGNENGEVPFCKCSDINDSGKYVSSAQNYVSYNLVKKNRYNLIPINSLIFAKIGEAMKKNHRKINIKECCIDNNVESLIIKNNDFDFNYGYYVMKNIDMEDFDNGGPVPSINNVKLNNLIIPSPNIKEQKLISSFLDEKTKKLEEVLNDLNKQIEILNKYKKSTITQLITKGINKNARIKNSGVNYISNIPEKWNVTKLKYIVSIFGRIGFRGYTQDDLTEEGNGAITLSPSNIINNKMNYDNCSYLRWNKYYESPEIMINNGDILFVKTGSTYGKSCYVQNLPMEATINPQFVVFKKKKNSNLILKYLSYYLLSDICLYQVEKIVVGSTIPTLSQEKLSNFYISYPPEEEQKEIVEYLDKKCSQIEKIIEDKQKQIDKIEEYKKSVIYEYVTGKKRVEGAEELYG